MKTIIAGSRDFNDYETLVSFCNGKNIAEVVSGTARGADKLGERFAESRDIPIKRFPANWDKFGKSAGYLRNSEMANYADACIVFWDGKSKGSKHMIDLAKEKGMDINIVYFRKEEII